MNTLTNAETNCAIIAETCEMAAKIVGALATPEAVCRAALLHYRAHVAAAAAASESSAAALVKIADDYWPEAKARD